MGKLLRLLVLAAAAYTIYNRLREIDRPAPPRPSHTRFAPPTGEDGVAEAGDTEPVLGYDGMDIQTVIPWLESAELDRATLRRVRSYEQRNRARVTVLETIDDLLR